MPAMIKKNGIVTLTKNRQDQVGNFTLKNKINLDYDFTLSGSVNLGSNSYGADGIGIAFHDGKTSDVGVSGGNLGIAGLENAFGFKLDSWYNSATRPNPNASTESNKFGWDKDPVRVPFGSFVTTTYKRPQGGRDNVWWAETEQKQGKDGYQTLNRNIYDGHFHDFSIDYNGNSHRMTITLKQQNNSLVWSQAVDVNNFSNKLAAFMMSGSTGGATNLQQFRINEFNYVAGQTAYVHYFDKTTGDELSVDEVTGQSGSTIEYTTSNIINNYENKGYILDSDEFIPGSVFDNDISVDQNYNVYLVHGIVPVNPEEPQEPGAPINPEDPDGPKWPAGTDETSLTADVNQTVHYQYADGTTAAADQTDTVHFTHQIHVDKVTGEVVQDDGWQAVDGDNVFDRKESPVTTGYTPSQAQSDAITGLEHDSQDNEQTIVYTANQEQDTPVNPGDSDNEDDKIEPDYPEIPDVTNVPTDEITTSTREANQTPLNESIQEESETTVAENTVTDKPELPQTGVNDKADNTKTIGVSILTIFSVVLSLFSLAKKQKDTDKNN